MMMENFSGVRDGFSFGPPSPLSVISAGNANADAKFIYMRFHFECYGLNIETTAK